MAGYGYTQSSVTFTPSAIRRVEAWYATGHVQPWLSLDAEGLRVSMTAGAGNADFDEMRALLQAGLVALDMLADSKRVGDEQVVVTAPWPPEQPEVGEQP